MCNDINVDTEFKRSVAYDDVYNSFKMLCCSVCLLSDYESLPERFKTFELSAGDYFTMLHSVLCEQLVNISFALDL